jgi:hypothetical protein
VPLSASAQSRVVLLLTLETAISVLSWEASNFELILHITVKNKPVPFAATYF